MSLTLAGSAPAGTAAELPVPATTGDVQASFERFALDWMQETRRLSVGGPASQAPGSDDPLGDHVVRLPVGEWSTEIRETRDPKVPYLGLLRYVEEQRICSAAPPATCRRTSTTVTEIFRLEDGRWVY